MVLVEKVLGNAGDPEWAQRLADVSVEPLSLDHWEAQKNRFRKKTASGREVAPKWTLVEFGPEAACRNESSVSRLSNAYRRIAARSVSRIPGSAAR